MRLPRMMGRPPDTPETRTMCGWSVGWTDAAATVDIVTWYSFCSSAIILHRHTNRNPPSPRRRVSATSNEAIVGLVLGHRRCAAASRGLVGQIGDERLGGQDHGGDGA